MNGNNMLSDTETAKFQVSHELQNTHRWQFTFYGNFLDPYPPAYIRRMSGFICDDPARHPALTGI